jgi:hypothetical protein
MARLPIGWNKSAINNTFGLEGFFHPDF